MPWSRGRCVDLKRQRLPIRPCRQRQNRPGRQPHRNLYGSPGDHYDARHNEEPGRQLRRQEQRPPRKRDDAPGEGRSSIGYSTPSGNMVLFAATAQQPGTGGGTVTQVQETGSKEPDILSQIRISAGRGKKKIIVTVPQNIESNGRAQ